jgi:hypothetical protein
MLDMALLHNLTHAERGAASLVDLHRRSFTGQLLATLQSAGTRPVFVISLWDLLNSMNTEQQHSHIDQPHRECGWLPGLGD